MVVASLANEEPPYQEGYDGDKSDTSNDTSSNSTGIARAAAAGAAARLGAGIGAGAGSSYTLWVSATVTRLTDYGTGRALVAFGTGRRRGIALDTTSEDGTGSEDYTDRSWSVRYTEEEEEERYRAYHRGRGRNKRVEKT